MTRAPTPNGPDPEVGPEHPKGSEGTGRSRRRRWAVRLAFCVGGLLVLAGAATALLLTLGRPRLSVSSSGEALFTVHVGGMGTELQQLRATSVDRPVALRRAGDGFVPVARLAQGQSVEVSAVAGPPRWLRWLVGSVTTTKTFHAPTAVLSSSVVMAPGPDRVPVRFDHPVSRVEYEETGAQSHLDRLDRPAALVDLQVSAAGAAGSLQLQVAPRPWERLSSTPSTVTWFVPPAGGEPVALASPTPGSTTALSNGAIRLRFDHPVSEALGASRPTLSPSVPGSWSQPSPDRLVFTPSGFGFGPGTSVTVRFDHPVVVTSLAATTTAAATSSYTFRVAAGSMVRMEQLLAQLHYLPLRFVPAQGVTAPTTFAQEVATMSEPLQGSFSWRWSSTPAALRALWTPKSPNVLLRGALMAFEASLPTFDGYRLDGESIGQMADASTWEALAKAAASDQLDPNPYSYVSVSKALPETLTLWENGATVLTALTNTGIAQDPTADGTFPIYVRFTTNYMSGTNPDGTKYHDLVHWINYFNGGDAVHGFVRASYGYPQSLGCVELPDATARTVFSDLAIGDLVTVAG